MKRVIPWAGLILLLPFLPDAQAGFRVGLGQAVAKKGAEVVNSAGLVSPPLQQGGPYGGGGGGNGGGNTSPRFLWHYVGEPVYFSSPAIGTDGTIYFATTGHFVYFNTYWLQGQKPPAKPYGLYAYNPNGTLKWKYSDGSDAPGRGAPAIGPDGTIYIVLERLTNSEYATTQELHAVKPDGSLKWKHTFCNVYAEIGSLTPSIAADGTIYVSCNELTAFHPDGTVYWSNPNGSANGNYLAPAIASDGTIYGIYWTAGLGGGQTLRAWNPDGSVKWTVASPLGSFPMTCPPSVATDGTIYIGGPDPALVGSNTGTLFAFDSSGSLKWKYAAGDYDIRSSPAIDADGTIYFGTKGTYGYIYAINSDGTFKWRHSSLDDAIPGANVDVYSSPTIGADGTIYTANEWGWIYAFNSDGSLKWKDDKIQNQGGTNWSSGALAPDGTMYIGNTYGEFLAFRTDSLGLKGTAQWPKFRYSYDNNGRRP